MYKNNLGGNQTKEQEKHHHHNHGPHSHTPRNVYCVTAVRGSFTFEVMIGLPNCCRPL
jgi:hypothetical protein